MVEKILSQEEFVKKYVESLDEFKKLPLVEEGCGQDIEKISRVHERYCSSLYSAYLFAKK